MELLQFAHACQRPLWQPGDLITLRPEGVEALRKPEWQRAQLVPRQIQDFQHSQFPEGVAMEAFTRQAVVAQVELLERIKSAEVIASDLIDEVSKQHKGVSTTRQAQRDTLQQVVVQVERVEALETTEGIAVDVASTKPVVVKQKVLKILHSAEGIDPD